MALKIILDTNFTMVPFQFKVDIFEELKRLLNEPYKVFILDQTLKELEGKKLEKAVKGLLERYDVGLIKTEQKASVDELLVNLADREKFIVATQDKALKDRLKKKGIKIITLRQKMYLAFG